MNIITSYEIEHECEIINDILINDDKVIGVRLLSIHEAKGLEFKCVFFISLKDGILSVITKNNEQLE